MDLLRTRAVSPLIVLVHAAFVDTAAHADCTKVDGTYRYESVERVNGEPERLVNLVIGPERNKVFKSEGGGAPGAGLGSAQPRSRPKVTHLATMVMVVYAPKNTRLRFMGPDGKVLAESRIEVPDPWACEGDRLVRRFERVGGLGENVRTERVEEVLERDAAGALVHRETVTIVEGGRGTKVQEAHYPIATMTAAR